MDAFITFTIVGIALLWAARRLRNHFASNRASSCGSCSGCETACSSKRLRAFGLVFFAALSPAALQAQEAETTEEEPPAIVQKIETAKSAFASATGGIEISGFFDMQAADRSNDPDLFSMGDFELDLARDLGKYAQVAAAVVANDEGANLAVGFVDVHFYGRLIAPRGRLPVEKGFHVQFGRFDVPFGQDWQFFAAKDRTELSAPLTTELLMDGGLNDVGLRVLGNSGGMNYSAFVIRSDASGSLYGGRLGLTPFDNPYRFEPKDVLEAGVSLLQDVDGSGATRTTFFAIDSEATIGRLRVRSEYLRKDDRQHEESVERTVHTGWHLTATIDAGEIAGVPITPYARFDTVDSLRTDRITAGVNGTLFGFLMMKAEYQRISEGGFRRNAWFAQAVIVF